MSQACFCQSRLVGMWLLPENINLGWVRGALESEWWVVGVSEGDVQEGNELER